MKIKRCVGWICVFFSLAAGAGAQVITVENGISVSKVKKMFDDKNVYPYQMSAGVEYWEHGRYNLSSGIGFLKKGGKANVAEFGDTPGIWGYINPLRLHARYLTLHTTFNVKTKPVSGFYWIFGVGPRLDIKINHSLYWDDYRPFEKEERITGLHPVVWGLKCVMGVRKEIGKLEIGLQAAYLPSFNKMCKTYDGFTGGRDRTFTVGLSFGYILQKEKGRHYSVRPFRENTETN